MHYLDEGEKSARALILLHGVPTWSYTFRHMIPQCVDAGCRVIAPDLPGFGLSDKKFQKQQFTLSWVTEQMKLFIGQLNLNHPVFFGHDWGGVIGCMLASESDNPFSGYILCNGVLPFPGMKAPVLFKIWRLFATISPLLPLGIIVSMGCNRRLSSIERAGYEFPFRSIREKRAIRWMPQLLPTGNRMQHAEWLEKRWFNLEKLTKPVLTVFSTGDPIARGAERIVLERIPGARNQKHVVITGGHFLQEDAPEEICNVVLSFLKTNQ